MLKGILAITGQTGLYRMLAESKNNIIVESLETGKRMPVYSSSKVSALEDIAIYTENGDIPLKNIFKSIFEKEEGGNTISHKSEGKILKKYFEEVVPDFDKERVYVSDIKKVLLWYNILHEHNMLDFSEEDKAEEDTESNNALEDNTEKEPENSSSE